MPGGSKQAAHAGRDTAKVFVKVVAFCSHCLSVGRARGEDEGDDGAAARVSLRRAVSSLPLVPLRGASWSASKRHLYSKLYILDACF